MKDKIRRIYILGAGTMQLPAIRIARGFGWEVICADGNPDAPGRAEAHYFEHIDLKDREGIAESVVDWRNRRGLDGVFTAGTDFSAAVAWAAEKAGLPGIPYQSALKASDKFLMRTAFAEAGVPSPRFAGIENPDQWREAFEKAGLPAVVKPVDNMGSRGIRRVDTLEDARSAVEAAFVCSASGRVIVEEYIEGPEFSLDALIYRGEFSLCGIADRHIRFAPYFIEVGHTMPSNFPEGDRQRIIDTFRNAAFALGIDNGAAKGDIKLGRSGPVVGEVAARLSGGYMSGWTYPLSSGVEVTAGALRIAVGEPPGDLAPVQQKTCAERAFYSIPGIIDSIDGFSDSMGSAAFLLTSPGSRVEFPRNNVEKCGNIICAAETREDACSRAEDLCRRVILRLAAGGRETLDFLRRRSHEWVPDAFTLEDPENRDWLRELEYLPDFASLRSTGPVIPLPPHPEKETACDWLGRSLTDALELIQAKTGVHAASERGNVGRQFWLALLRGGYQGGLWFLDTLNGSADQTGYGEIEEFPAGW